MLSLEEIQAIPKPQTEAEYAACYRANVVEARDNLLRAQERFDNLRRAGHITENAEKDSGYIFANETAKKAHGDVVRWASDLEHWHKRMIAAEKGARAEAVMAPDSRLPPEHEELEEAPF